MRIELSRRRIAALAATIGAVAVAALLIGGTKAKPSHTAHAEQEGAAQNGAAPSTPQIRRDEVRRRGAAIAEQIAKEEAQNPSRPSYTRRVLQDMEAFGNADFVPNTYFDDELDGIEHFLANRRDDESLLCSVFRRILQHHNRPFGTSPESVAEEEEYDLFGGE